MIGSAWASQRRRSGGPIPNSKPKAVCSGSNQAAPMPSTARPPLMWSIVVIILATSAGLRNVLAPTRRPIVARLVAPPTAAMAVYASRIGPSQEPTMG